MIVEWEADIVTVDGLAARPAGISVWRFRHGRCTHARDYFDETAMLETIWGRREPAPVGAG